MKTKEIQLSPINEDPTEQKGNYMQSMSAHAKDFAKWQRNILTLHAYYGEYFEDHKVYTMERVSIGSKNDTYWVSADGESFAIDGKGDCCISIVERALHLAGSKRVYCTFRRNMETLNKWERKWNKATSVGVHPFVSTL